MYNIYGEYIIKNVLYNWGCGVAIKGKKLDNSRYADDTVLLAS